MDLIENNLGLNIFQKLLTFCRSKPNSLNPCRPDIERGEKINLNFYFHASLWCLKRFYEGLKGLHKTFLRHDKEV